MWTLILLSTLRPLKGTTWNVYLQLLTWNHPCLYVVNACPPFRSTKTFGKASVNVSRTSMTLWCTSYRVQLLQSDQWPVTRTVATYMAICSYLKSNRWFINASVHSSYFVGMLCNVFWPRPWLEDHNLLASIKVSAVGGEIARYLYRISRVDIWFWIFPPFHLHLPKSD